MPDEIQQLRTEFEEHTHDGNNSRQVQDIDLFGNVPSRVNVKGGTIATTGNTDEYVIAPISGHLASVDFSGTDALAANDTNYITFSVVNLLRDGTGSTNILSTGDENTTKATGGAAIAANTVRELTLSNSSRATIVAAGDRLRIRAAATGTLANTVTNPIYLLRFK